MAPRILPTDITPESVYERRREFLKGSLALALYAALPAQAALPAWKKTAWGRDESANTWEEITTYNNFYEFGTGKDDPAKNAGGLRTRPWTVSVEGECLKPRAWDIDALIKAHLEFFATRMDDFILYFQGRADLTIKESYEGIDEPILAYLDHIADLLDDVIMYHLQRNTLIRIAWAVAGFVSGYFSFAVISYEEEKLDETLEPVRKALVVGLSRFIKEAIPKIAETQQSLL